jgi:hypothetical protein
MTPIQPESGQLAGEQERVRHCLDSSDFDDVFA